MTHEMAQSLLGAAAVGSLPSDEQDQLDAHLSGCETCRIDLSELRSTASMLSTGGELPPERIWEGIESQLGTAPPPMRLVPARRRSVRGAWAVAAAVALAVLSSVVTAGLMGTDRQPPTAAPTTIDRALQSASVAPGARSAVMSSNQGQPVAEIVLLPDGQAYLRNIALQPLPVERTYQLWALDGSSPVSAGLFGARPSTSAFAPGPGVTKLAITDERSEGVAAPSGTPIATATLNG